MCNFILTPILQSQKLRFDITCPKSHNCYAADPGLESNSAPSPHNYTLNHLPTMVHYYNTLSYTAFQAPWNIFILWLYLRNHAMAPLPPTVSIISESFHLPCKGCNTQCLSDCLHPPHFLTLSPNPNTYECSLHFGPTHLSDDLLFFSLCLSICKSLIYSNFLFSVPNSTNNSNFRFNYCMYAKSL